MDKMNKPMRISELGPNYSKMPSALHERDHLTGFVETVYRELRSEEEGLRRAFQKRLFAEVEPIAEEENWGVRAVSGTPHSRSLGRLLIRPEQVILEDENKRIRSVHFPFPYETRPALFPGRLVIDFLDEYPNKVSIELERLKWEAQSFNDIDELLSVFPGLRKRYELYRKHRPRPLAEDFPISNLLTLESLMK